MISGEKCLSWFLIFSLIYSQESEEPVVVAGEEEEGVVAEGTAVWVKRSLGDDEIIMMLSLFASDSARP